MHLTSCCFDWLLMLVTLSPVMNPSTSRTMCAFTITNGLKTYVVLQMFGKLQSKLFPKYFALLSAACVICMGTITFSPGASLPKSQTIALGMASCLFTTLQAMPITTPIPDACTLPITLPFTNLVAEMSIMLYTAMHCGVCMQ